VTEVFLHTIGVSESRDSLEVLLPAVSHDNLGSSFVFELKMRSTSATEKTFLTRFLGLPENKAKSVDMAVLGLTFRNVSLGKWSKN